MADDSYCLISPCRDEARYIRRTLDTVTAQTAPPALWVIVDDGSTDETPQILAEYAARFPYIRVLRRDDRGRRSVGPGVVEAFYHGYHAIDPRQFAFIGKLDMDLDLPPRYFELLIARMHADPRLGTCSGKPYYVHPRTGELVSERCGDEMSVGMTKFYRRECFEQIGGLARHVMWDGIDCHQSRMMGWKARSWDEPELRFVHLRAMGSSEGNIIRGRMRHGGGQYYMGTGLAYMTVSAMYRMLHRPFFIGGLAMWWGYVKSMVARKPRFESPEFRRFLRRYHWACLFRGKRRATEQFESVNAERWQPSRRAGSPALEVQTA